ncbi:VOC family protein [Paracoccus sp. (in: a-proteobacteria)]|uniref:VOC family protein n=1 Tax=Paracoccus sp. TaxID=267 RepID=UPI0026DEB7E8|nr:VOC family protein [Paracoccus sp. (in: a-proteobacteria)]MDO5646549.1 VOC family protein [Paracoccus sp. (in: a-proteobacteria)]
MRGLTPEPIVTDVAESLRFYDRPEWGFARLRMGGVNMIEAIHRGRNVDATLTEEDHPFGRRMNLEINVESAAPLLDALHAAGWPVEDKWYRTGAQDTGQRHFVTADFDGYYLRLCPNLGERDAV